MAVERILSVLTEAFCEPLGTRLPSTNRWHTFGPTLAVQAGGMLCHQVMPRTLKCLDVGGGAPQGGQVGQQPGEDNAEDSVDSWQVHITKKLKQCWETVSDQPDSSKLWGVGLFATEALDHLSARLQHLDSCGYALKELVNPSGLLYEFQRHTWSLLNPRAVAVSEHSQKLSTILTHLRNFAGDSFDTQGCYDDFRGYTLTIASAVWARMELKFWDWPWRIVRGVLPAGGSKSHTDYALKELDAFFNEDRCCLDSWTSLWLRSSVKVQAELSAEDFQGLLRQLERRCLSTNMLLEGLLAEVKRSCPRPTAKGCNAEKFAYLGVLQQLMRRHLQAGKRDSRSTTFDDLKRAGVPLDIPRSVGARGGHQRPDSAYVMKRLHTFLTTHPECTQDEREVTYQFGSRTHRFQSCPGQGQHVRIDMCRLLGSLAYRFVCRLFCRFACLL